MSLSGSDQPLDAAFDPDDPNAIGENNGPETFDPDTFPGYESLDFEDLVSAEFHDLGFHGSHNPVGDTDDHEG